MNRKVMKVVFVATIALVGGINVFNAQKTETLSDTVLANVEALAACEDTGNYTGLREYTAENGCFCLNCPEQFDSSCTCR